MGRQQETFGCVRHAAGGDGSSEVADRANTETDVHVDENDPEDEQDEFRMVDNPEHLLDPYLSEKNDLDEESDNQDRLPNVRIKNH